MPKRSGSSARGGRAAASVQRTRRKIDFSDIPDSSPEQLVAMRRVGRPPLGKEPRQLIAIRVDPGVLESFRKEARRRRVGYQTLINEVLADTPQGRRVAATCRGPNVCGVASRRNCALSAGATLEAVS